jgi:hypothetical protein
MTQPDFADVNLLPTKNGLDFGVHYNYDIKYRMGREAAEEE